MCGGLLLLGVPACLCGGACQAGDGLEYGPLSWDSPPARVHCVCCGERVRSQARNNSLLRWSKAGPTGSVRGVAPFFCPGGAAVDRWLGSFQFRPPCRECVGKPREEKRKLFDCEKRHSVLGVGYWLLPGVFTRSPGPSWGLGGAP